MLLIFSVVIVIIPVSLSIVITVLNPGLFLILISDLFAPFSISKSFATFLNISKACSLFNSSGKFSRRASIIWSPLSPC